jgi:hypothetical protein
MSVPGLGRAPGRPPKTVKHPFTPELTRGAAAPNRTVAGASPNATVSERTASVWGTGLGWMDLHLPAPAALSGWT